MVMDISLVLKAGKKDWFWISATGGIVPQASVQNGVSTLLLIPTSREHFMGFRVAKPVTLMVGKMDQIYGIRIPDHTAFSRTMPGVAQNDQTYALAGQFAWKRVEFSAQIFVGDFLQPPDLWHKGISGQIEVEVAKEITLGASQLWSQNQYFRRLQTALHSRIGVSKGHSFLIEAGSLWPKAMVDGAPVTNGGYFLFQGSQRAVRGLHVIETIEMGREVFSSLYPLRLRISPGLQWMPIQRIELRADLTYALNLGTDTPAFPGTWGLAAQLVLSL
jgi:hypothetical protein